MVGSLCLVVLATWGFVMVASEVAEGRTKAFDDRRSCWPSGCPGDLARPIGPDWVAESARDVTALGSTSGPPAGDLRRRRLPGARPAILRRPASCWRPSLAAGRLSVALKSAFDRPRPELVPHLMRVYFSSFPSGHSMMAAVVYGTLGSPALEPRDHGGASSSTSWPAPPCWRRAGRGQPGLSRRALPDRRPRRLGRRPRLVDPLLAGRSTPRTIGDDRADRLNHGEAAVGPQPIECRASRFPSVSKKIAKNPRPRGSSVLPIKTRPPAGSTRPRTVVRSAPPFR